MTDWSRTRVVLPGALALAILGVALTCLSVSSFAARSAPVAVATFAASVVFAPIFLAWKWTQHGLPWETIALAWTALVAVPVHPIWPRTVSAVLTVLGLLAWLACEVIVAGAPA